MRKVSGTIFVLYSPLHSSETYVFDAETISIGNYLGSDALSCSYGFPAQHRPVTVGNHHTR